MNDKCFYLLWCLYASQVRDFDKFSRNTVLGDVRVPLGQLNISYPLELQEDLKIPQKVLQGAHTQHTACTQDWLSVASQVVDVM